MRTGTVYGAEWGRIFYMIKGPVYRTRVTGFAICEQVQFVEPNGVGFATR